MDELVTALARLRFTGISEADALTLVARADTLVTVFPEGSLGRTPSVAESFVESGCATCAVNKAFADRR